MKKYKNLTREKIFELINKERKRQYKKYKDNPKATKTQMVRYIVSELAEVNACVLDQGEKLYSKHRYIEELIQVAALAIQSIEREMK